MKYFNALLFIFITFTSIIISASEQKWSYDFNQRTCVPSPLQYNNKVDIISFFQRNNSAIKFNFEHAETQSYLFVINPGSSNPISLVVSSTFEFCMQLGNEAAKSL
jgi:hypothetical protein